MKVRGYNIAVEKFLYLILIYSALIGFILIRTGISNLNGALAITNFAGDVVAIDAISVILFSKWLWRIKILHPWLVPFPDLNGEWTGKICSNWTDEDGNGVDDIDATLTIKQTFLSISCVMKTSEMTSRSFAEGFTIDDERQLKQLCYSYTTKPLTKYRKRSAPADGTVLFDITESPERNLEGEYWTQKPSTGSIKVSFKK